MSNSFAEDLANLPEDEREAIFKDYTEEDFKKMAYDWSMWGRPEQMPPDDGSWRIFLALAGRGWGKLTTVHTKIPTPSGWREMGDLEAGDYVFDENGRPTRVKQAFTPYTPDKMFRLTFSDGTTVECGEEHLWTTWTARDRKSYNRRNDYVPADKTVGVPDNWPTWTKENKNGMTDHNPIGPKTRNTQEIFDTFRYGKRGDLNHSIPVMTSPIKYAAKKLLVDPYVFGAWLGDGSVSSGQITSHNAEIDWMRTEIETRGYPTTMGPVSLVKNCRTINIQGSLRSQLREIKSLSTKHIPTKYLQGSEQQRRDLLAGLLDTDGYISPENGQIEFCAKRKEHAEAVVELARSLGQKPVMFEGRATLNGTDHGIKYRVKWRPTENLFYMPRKAAMFRPLGAQASRVMHRMITKIEEIEPVLSRCIAVESPNHLFLCGEGMIPTHNSRAGAEWIKKKVEEAEEAGTPIKVLLLGRTSADVRDVMVSAILECYPEGEKPEYSVSNRRITWPKGSYALCASSEKPDQLRGPQGHIAWADELAALKATKDDSGATAWTNLMAATRLGDTPQIFGTTTPKRTKLMKELVEDSADPKRRIKIIKGSTFENYTLSKAYLEDITAQYGDSELAKQELYGEMLGDAEGLFFTQQMIDEATIDPKQVPHLPLKFIAVDPSVAERPGDECGIMAVGVTGEAGIHRRTAYILEDYSIKGPPDVWVNRIVTAAKEHNTRFVVVEGNQGRQLLQMVINGVEAKLKVFLVNASQGKHKRAEPVIVKMQQKKVKIVDLMPDLTDQMMFFDPEDTKGSPDRMDAMVWGVIAALIDPPEGLQMYRSRLTSPANLKLPSGRGTGRSRVPSSLRGGGGRSGPGGRKFG